MHLYTFLSQVAKLGSTRLYDEAKRVTLPMRSKEDAPDYRYFPDPDLVEVELDEDLIDKIRKVGEVYERSIQFEHWRKIALPKVENDLVKTGKKGPATYLKWSIILVILVGLIAPYHYEPGGNFVILANQKQEITSDITGIVDEVYFDGGEYLKKGAVIAKCDSTDYLAQMKIYTAKVQEQQSVVNDTS